MSWTTNLTLPASINILDSVSRVCLELSKHGPLTKYMYSLVKSRDFESIIKYQFDYQEDRCTGVLCPQDLLYARQIQALFSKNPALGIRTSKEIKDATIDSFLASEEKCRDTNIRFRRRELNEPGNPDVEAVLSLTRRKISEILGPVPSISELHFSFGPGTNTSTKRKNCNARIKLSSSPQCSENLLPYAEQFLIEVAPTWLLSMKNPITVAVGKWVNVAKNALIGRTVIPETLLNGFGQKGIGRWIRARLKTVVNLDLSKQSINQMLAYRGSINNDISTIDVVAASDTIAYCAVLDLLPLVWFHFLEAFRSSQVEMPDGKIIDLQKFSCMGNAYTFELETLIFYSLAISVTEYLKGNPTVVRAYGDDITVSTNCTSLLIEVLEYCGFEVNTKKSHIDGPFRESCGADYYRGLDIRPFYLKDRLNERILYSMHNFFVRSCEPRLAKEVLKFIRMDVALWGPDGYGDGHLIGNHVLRSSRKLKRRGYGGGVFDTYTLKPRRNHKKFPGDWVFPCYSIYVTDGEADSLDSDHDIDHIVDCFGVSLQNDPDIVPGTKGYAKLSIYTLASSIFRRAEQS